MTAFSVVSPAPRGVWADVLAHSATALISQTPDWLDCVCAVGPFRDASRLYEFADGLRIVVPMARRRGPLRVVCGIGSWPFDWGAAGPVADGPVDSDHAAAVYSDLAAVRSVRVSLRLGSRAGSAWHEAPREFLRTNHISQSVNLAGGFSELWSGSFKSSVRRAVRKAEHHGIEVEVDRTGRLIPVFAELYRQSIDRWAKAQHEPLALSRWRMNQANPARKFEAVADRLGDRCAVWVARNNGEPAAALIVLNNQWHARYWRGAMDADLAGPVRANDLLHRHAIEDAADRGLAYYDMGESTPGSGLARFKAGFGAQAHDTPSLCRERLPISRTDARLRSLVKRAIKFEEDVS